MQWEDVVWVCSESDENVNFIAAKRYSFIGEECIPQKKLTLLLSKKLSYIGLPIQ